jgi:receptor protein-tyrosine kinase
MAAAVSLAFALLVGAWLVRFAERADRSMHRPEDVELAAGAPLLAAIPGGERASPEPFLRLRDAIVYLGGQRTRSTLIVTSPMGEEGRTSVAIGLAHACVAAGRSVVLVDADLRNPQIASRSGVPPGVGLADVLIGGDLEAALQADGGAGTGLTILPAGSPGPRSPDLLASARMASVMRELSERFDTVVIDTPPLLAFSDALPLLPGASGVVLVARIDHTMRGALSRAVQILKDAGANVLGPVATGASAHPRAAESVAAYAPEPEPAFHAPGG